MLIWEHDTLRSVLSDTTFHKDGMILNILEPKSQYKWDKATSKFILVEADKAEGRRGEPIDTTVNMKKLTPMDDEFRHNLETMRDYRFKFTARLTANEKIDLNCITPDAPNDTLGKWVTLEEQTTKPLRELIIDFGSPKAGKQSPNYKVPLPAGETWTTLKAKYEKIEVHWYSYTNWGYKHDEMEILDKDFEDSAIYHILDGTYVGTTDYNVGITLQSDGIQAYGANNYVRGCRVYGILKQKEVVDPKLIEVEVLTNEKGNIDVVGGLTSAGINSQVITPIKSGITFKAGRKYEIDVNSAMGAVDGVNRNYYLVLGDGSVSAGNWKAYSVTNASTHSGGYVGIVWNPHIEYEPTVDETLDLYIVAQQSVNTGQWLRHGHRLEWFINQKPQATVMKIDPDLVTVDDIGKALTVLDENPKDDYVWNDNEVKTYNIDTSKAKYLEVTFRETGASKGQFVARVDLSVTPHASLESPFDTWHVRTIVHRKGATTDISFMDSAVAVQVVMLRAIGYAAIKTVINHKLVPPHNLEYVAHEIAGSNFTYPKNTPIQFDTVVETSDTTDNIKYNTTTKKWLLKAGFRYRLHGHLATGDAETSPRQFHFESADGRISRLGFVQGFNYTMGYQQRSDAWGIFEPTVDTEVWLQIGTANYPSYYGSFVRIEMLSTQTIAVTGTGATYNDTAVKADISKLQTDILAFMKKSDYDKDGNLIVDNVDNEDVTVLEAQDDWDQA